MRHARGQQGINLVELVVAMSIAAISLTLGVPAFESLRINADRSSAIIELVAAARLARSEAALRGTAVSLCPSTNGTSCSGGSDWSSGWIVFRDEDEGLSIDAQNEILKVVRFDNPRFTITADDAIGAGITFGHFGFSRPSFGTLDYSDSHASRTLELSYIGRLHVTETVSESS